MPQSIVPNLFKLATEFLYQPIKPFGTTQPVHFIAQGSIGNLLAIKPFSLLKRFFPDLQSKITTTHINERILEIPFIFKSVPAKPSQEILDIGSCESTVSLSLATLGHKVTALDFRPYPLNHPNLKSVQEDICTTTLPKKSFDIVICLSTLEHVGFNTLYGKSTSQMSAAKAVIQMHRVLKPGGKLLLTIPTLASHAQTNFMQFFTPKELRVLLKPFKKFEVEYFRPLNNHSKWVPCSTKEISQNPKDFAVALITASA